MKGKGKEKHRDCESCIAYSNMLGGPDYRCGLGFQVEEALETDERQRWRLFVRPFQDVCEVVPQPKTKEEFVRTAKERGIDWDIDEVLDAGETIFD